MNPITSTIDHLSKPTPLQQWVLRAGKQIDEQESLRERRVGNGSPVNK